MVLNPLKPQGLAERYATCEELTDALFALMMLSDDRSIERCYIAGKLAYSASAQ